MSSVRTLVSVVDAFIRRHSLNRAKFAKKVGVTPEHLSRILHGKSSLTPDMRDKFFNVFDGEAKAELNLIVGKTRPPVDVETRRRLFRLLLEAWNYRVITIVVAILNEDEPPLCVFACDGFLIITDKPISDDHKGLLLTR